MKGDSFNTETFNNDLRTHPIFKKNPIFEAEGLHPLRNSYGLNKTGLKKPTNNL